MLSSLIAIIAILTLLIVWIISIQRKLVVLDENVNNAMCQIGMQLSSRFDALTALLDFTGCYAEHECEPLIETVRSKRSLITVKSKPDDVLRQEGVIYEALSRIAIFTEQYPKLKESQNYINTMGAVQTFENMLRTSRLIYNDSVTKLNREIKMFPVCIIAGILGFRKRDYLEEQVGIPVTNQDKIRITKMEVQTRKEG